MTEGPKPIIVRYQALIPKELHDQLRRVAFENGLSGTSIVRDALRRELARYENTKANRATGKRRARQKRNGGAR